MNIKVSSRINFTNITLLLLAINIIACFIQLFGFHNSSLISLASSGLVLLILFYIKRTTNENLKIKLLVGFLFAYGILVNFEFSKYVLFLIDISSFGLIFSVLLLDKLKLSNVKIGLLFMALIAIAGFSFSIPYMDLSLIQSGSNRSDAFTSLSSDIFPSGASKGYIIYVNQQLAVSYLIFFFLLVPLIVHQVKKKYLISIIVVSIFFIILYSAFYQKRQSLLELIEVIILLLVLNKKSLKGLVPQNSFINILFLFIILFLIFNLGILSNVFERFSTTLKDVGDFDRIEESRKTLSEFSFLEWIIGKGIGYVAPNTPGGINLHIGYSNLIMKGGIILLGFYVYQTLKNIVYCWKRSKKYSEYKIGLTISIFSLIQLTYSPGYQWYATTLITGLAMFSRYPLKSLVYDIYYNNDSQQLRIYREKHKINSAVQNTL